MARQYPGTLGKVGNCQVAVSICAVTDGASCPLNWRLFLPAGWDDTAASTPQEAAVIRVRRARAGLPAEARHREKWRLALDMLEELAGWGLAPPVWWLSCRGIPAWRRPSRSWPSASRRRRPGG